MPPARRRLAPVSAFTGAVMTLAILLAACSDDDDAAPDTEPVAPIVDGPEIVTEPSGNPEFLERILEDDEVTADELSAAYESFVQCLADGGGYGRYAYDVSLLAPLNVDWRLPGDDAQGSRSASLDAGCSRDYLGDLARRYELANPPDDEVMRRQRDGIAACVREVNPAAAAEIPDEITTDTGGEGFYIGDVQQDIRFLGADPEEADAIALCFSTLGAPWRSFGQAPPESASPPQTSPDSGAPADPASTADGAAASEAASGVATTG